VKSALEYRNNSNNAGQRWGPRPRSIRTGVVHILLLCVSLATGTFGLHPRLPKRPSRHFAPLRHSCQSVIIRTWILELQPRFMDVTVTFGNPNRIHPSLSPGGRHHHHHHHYYHYHHQCKSSNTSSGRLIQLEAREVMYYWLTGINSEWVKFCRRVMFDKKIPEKIKHLPTVELLLRRKRQTAFKGDSAPLKMYLDHIVLFINVEFPRVGGNPPPPSAPCNGSRPCKGRGRSCRR